MSLDEELRKLKREGAEPARLIVAKLRAGIITTNAIRLAASLGHGGAIEAVKRLGLSVNVSWPYLTNLLEEVAREAAKIPANSSLSLDTKSTNLVLRILISYACDVAEHVLPHFEAENDDKHPRIALTLARQWAAGLKLNNDKIHAARVDAENSYIYSRVGYCAAGAARSVIKGIDLDTVEAIHDPLHATLEIVRDCISHASAAAYDGERSVAAGDAARKMETRWQRFRLAEYALGDI